MQAGLTGGVDRAALAASRLPGDPHAFALPQWILQATRAITLLGGWAVRLPLAVAGMIWLGRSGRRRERTGLAVSVLGIWILGQSLKLLFARARPDPAWRLAVESGASFPSGHALGAMATYPLLALLLAPTRRRRKAIGAAVVLALLIGLSRILLGVHWLSDVIGGWLLGGAWLLATIAFLVSDRRRSAA